MINGSPKFIPRLGVIGYIARMILVVEDHADSRSALVRLFQKAGLEAVGVADGAQALLYLETSLPKVMLLDLHLPHVDGMELLRQIREQSRLAGMSVMIHSAGDPVVERERALALGAQDYLVKGSLNWPELLTRVQAQLAERGKADGAATAQEC